MSYESDYSDYNVALEGRPLPALRPEVGAGDRHAECRVHADGVPALAPRPP